MNENLNFTDQNFVGKIIHAKVKDLNTNQEYDLETKPDSRRGGTSRCLFTPDLSVKSTNGVDYSLRFRVDFSDLRNGSPTLDLGIFDIGGDEITVEEHIHHTAKGFESNIEKWIYNTSRKVIKLKNDPIILNFVFQLEMTVQQTICGGANIVRPS